VNDWKIRKLGEVCQIKPPKGEAKQKVSSTDLVSFIPMSDLGIQTKFIPLNEKKLLSEVVGSYTYFADNDVLLAKITPCFENGKIGIARNLTNGIGFGSSEYLVFLSKGIIEPEYLFYLLSQDSFRNAGARVMTGAVGHKRVAKDFIENYPIPFPPLPEQKRIVGILDEAFEGIDRAIANTEKNLTNARELFESYLNVIFTQQSSSWEAKRLGNISEVQSGGTPSRSKSDYWGGHLAWYSSGELNELYTTSPERNITNEGLANSNSKLFPKGSLLIGMYDTAALKMSILDREAAFNQAIAGVKPNKKIDLVFILHAINFVKPEILSLRRGVRQKNLSLQKIKDIVLVIPELQEQQRVVQELASVKKETQYLEAIYRKKLAALNELKQSILQKAFTGELTADTVKQAIETAEQDRPISQDCLRSTETIKQKVHQSGQLSLWV
jgi:type I restriction enzyme, S subunit